MEKLVGLNTELGTIVGRDAIYLNEIIFSKESSLTLAGELILIKGTKFKMSFHGIVFLSTIELDFDKRGQMESLATVENSEKISEFKKLDRSVKIADRHRHYYIRTYDIVFEIISDQFELTIET